MGFHSHGGIQNCWFTMDNLIKIDDLEVPHFMEIPNRYFYLGLMGEYFKGLCMILMELLNCQYIELLI